MGAGLDNKVMQDLAAARSTQGALAFIDKGTIDEATESLGTTDMDKFSEEVTEEEETLLQILE